MSESYRRTNEPSPLEVEGSTAGASGGRDHGMSWLQWFVISLSAYVAFWGIDAGLALTYGWHRDLPLWASLALGTSLVVAVGAGIPAAVKGCQSIRRSIRGG